MHRLTLRSRACADRSILSCASWHVLACLVAGLLTAIATSTPAAAQNRFWITTLGGNFSSTANWATTAGGAAGASVPGAADNANFTINSVYTVSHTANTTNAGVLVANGGVTLDMDGFTYTVTGASGTAIGTTVAQTGRLTIKDGTYAVDSSDDRISVGKTATAAGFLTVSTAGRLGNGIIDPDLLVGESGTGTFAIESNGRADVGFMNLGQNVGSSGTVTVGGPNTVLDGSESVTVGFNGTGSLTLQNGGKIATASFVKVGNALGSSGTVNITGLNSTWNQGSVLTVGDSGDGNFGIQSSALVNTADQVLIGNLATGVGTAVVTGTDSTWNMASSTQIGVVGLGNFLVSAAGRANTLGAAILGSAAGSQGNAVVTGSGSRWSTGAMLVGSAGNASLTINAAGVMNSTGNVTLGNTATGVANVALSGSGSAWNITGAMTIANAGTGTLTVDTDAALSVTGALAIGDPAGAQVGTLNFNGGSISAGSFSRTGSAAFKWTDGTLLVTGGTFSNGGAGLTISGSDLDDLPALRLAGGAQATNVNTPTVTIATNRQGALIVSGGSSFQTNTASIGSQDGGNGSLHVEGLNSTFIAFGDLAVGGTSATAGGLGAITLGPGGTIAAGGTLRLWDGGTINLLGGTLRFTNLAANGGKAVFTSGTVQTLSNFNANAAALDALLGPTHELGTARKIDTQTNTLNLQSNITVSGGTLAGNLLSISSNVVAQFAAGGTATFSGGITNPAGARTYVTDASVAAGTTFTNGGEVHLAGATATINATNFSNTGLVEGSGRINSALNNNAAGQIRVAAGQRLEILGAVGHVNNGLIDVDGGTIEFGSALTNSNVNPSSGLIAARSATLRFQAGLANSGAMTFSSGVSDVFGDVTNQNTLSTPGRIIVTGGAQVNFYDDVANSGTIQVSAAGSLQSTAVFLGSLSGNGVLGAGHVFIEGDARPGFSPGTMAFGGDVSFGPLSSLNIELGGTAPGTQYDRVTAATTAAIGGDLNVSLYNGFKPTIGNSFQIVSAGGGVAGTFSHLALPLLAGGASWDLNYGDSAITLSVGGVLGDFNLDGHVDSADYTRWRDLLGTNSLAADASGNGTVDMADYAIWKANFGAMAASGGGSLAAPVSVPEPAAVWLCLAVVLIVPTAFRATSRNCAAR
jgi:T5SS/PEP-CTERM-associated repeat protein